MSSALKIKHEYRKTEQFQLTEEVSKAEVLVISPFLVFHLGFHEAIIPAQGVSYRVVIVGAGALAIKEDYQETRDKEMEGEIREWKEASARAALSHRFLGFG